MPILIMFRSLTYAQRGARVLERFGISAAVTKAPMKTTDKGCSYCVRVSEAAQNRAFAILQDSGIAYGRVFQIKPDGEYREVPT